LLFGLYPLGTGPSLPNSEEPVLPLAFHPIPVHVVPQAQETLLIPDQDHKRFDSILAKNVFMRTDWKQKNNELKAKLIAWHQLSGMELKNIHELEFLADNLYVYQVHHIPYPQGLSNEEAQQIIDAGRWAFATTYKAKEIGALERPLLAVVINYLKDASKNSSPLKFVLFSAHDSTILGLLDAMNAPLDMPPRYASNVNVALFKTPSDEYKVKVSFNGEPVVIPACGGSTCSLEKFAALGKA
jgi:acid phosphatase